MSHSNSSKKFVIGLTGGIASGKSSAAKFFQQLDIDVVSADAVAHDLMQANSPLVKLIQSTFIENFDQDVVDSHGALDRSRLRELIFSNTEARIQLDNLTHPAIGKELLKRINETQSTYCIAEIPLLIEAKMQNMVDRVLVVHINRDQQIQRIIERDNVEQAQAERAIDAQLNPQERLVAADDVIHNNGTLAKLKQQVALLHSKYQHLANDIVSDSDKSDTPAAFSGLELI